MAKGTIAIFFWDGWLGVAPSLINAIRLLSDAGYGVDIITRYPQNKYAEIPHFSADVRVLFCATSQSRFIGWNNTDSSSANIPKSYFFAILKVFSKSFKRVLQKLSSQILFIAERIQFLKFSYHTLKNRKYLCFIGVDSEGLITATIMSFFARMPILYWSLEIIFLNQFKFIDWDKRLVKHLERICHRKVLLTIIQDKQRAKALMDENRVKAKVVIVTNAPLGAPPKLSSNYFQHKFGLPDSQRIILSMGWISEYFLSLEVAEVASKWPDTWTLIFHDRAKREPSEPYLENIQKVGGKHVVLSLDPVSFDELDFLYSSGHIGIVVYNKNYGPNFGLMAGASGKLGYYLRCGLPVICLSLPGLSETIREYQCGVVVEDLHDVNQAIEIIFKNYAFYKANAIKCYEEFYEFGSHFRNVLKEIEALNV